MKRLFFAAMCAAIVSLGLVSCAKEDPAEGVNVDSALPCRATISGTAYVNINQGGNTLVEFAKAGTVLTLTATNASLLGDNNLPGNHVATTTVGTDGTFSAAFPARTDGTAVTVTITAGEFLLKDIYSGANNYSDATFAATPVEVAVIRDATYVKDLQFNSTVLSGSQKQAGWEKGTYVFKNIRYRSDNTDYTVMSTPSEFEVKITVGKNNFIPARQSDLILTGKVTNGTLTIELDAPTVAVHTYGLPFTVTGATILDVKGAGNITNKYIFSFNDSGSIFGGANARIEENQDILMTRGTQITFNE